ncbi:hypothetical protein EV122DRAFT_211868 [Schizophyllum commune]
MYKNRYEVPRTRHERPPESYLHHVLLRLKHANPDHFREHLRMYPHTFDELVARIQDDVVFTNNSATAHQAPVEEQLAVALYRFGHDGNAAGWQATADWAGIGKGSVQNYVQRVMTALLRPSSGFMQEVVQLPTAEEKEEAKEWVEEHSCRGWRGGWCFVDGTLVPLARRPVWYGESYFDRKSRYSLNIQVSVAHPVQRVTRSPRPTDSQPSELAYHRFRVWSCWECARCYGVGGNSSCSRACRYLR